MTRAPSTSGREKGAALVTVVLLALALFAVGHGMIAVSLGELAASRAAVRHLEARTAAEAAVYEAFGAPGWPWMDSLARAEARGVGTRTLGRAESSGVLRRLTAESWWVEGTGRVGVAESRTARLAWALDPLERVVSLTAVVGVGVGAPIVLTGSVEATSPTAVEPPLDAADCAPWAVALEAHYLSDPLSEVAVLPVADSMPRIGLMGFSDLLADADVMVSGSGSPGPVEWLGACAASAPWNWGDPERSWRPCGSHLPLRGAYGPLHVSGGVGQALLVVDGDVTLDGGTRLFGLVIASGELRVEGGAELVGFAIAQGGVVVAADGRVRGSACWAARALAAQRATLGRLRPVPGVGVIGPI
jgi:hypothetical protein